MSWTAADLGLTIPDTDQPVKFCIRKARPRGPWQWTLHTFVDGVREDVSQYRSWREAIEAIEPHWKHWVKYADPLGDAARSMRGGA